jgi:hypothetical protein
MEIAKALAQQSIRGGAECVRARRTLRTHSTPSVYEETPPRAPKVTDLGRSGNFMNCQQEWSTLMAPARLLSAETFCCEKKIKCLCSRSKLGKIELEKQQH